MFGDGRDNFPESVTRYLRLFDRHVRDGRFTRRDRFVPIEHPTLDSVHEIYFTLPGEEWRIDAKIELYARPGRWDAAKERRLGEILGYTDEQNDFWLSWCAKKKPGAET